MEEKVRHDSLWTDLRHFFHNFSVRIGRRGILILLLTVLLSGSVFAGWKTGFFAEPRLWYDWVDNQANNRTDNQADDQAEIIVIVKDAQSSRPLVGIPVEANGQVLETDGWGKVFFERLPIGEVTFKISLPGFKDIFQTAVLDRGPNKELVFSLQIATTILSGAVVDYVDGTPVAGAKITVPSAESTTDKDGKFLLEEVIIGTPEVTISKEGYYDLVQTVELVKDVAKDMGMLKLQRRECLNGCCKENSCYRCLKDGADIAGACYNNQQECGEACSIILSAECHTDSDCDDRASNTLDFCEYPSTKNAKCVNRLFSCVDLVKTGDIAKNLDIIFVPDKIDDQELGSFQNKLNEHINTILSVEPFKSKKEKINFHFLKVSENFGYFDGTSPGPDKVRTSVQTGCGNMDEILVMMGEGALGRASIFATLGGHFAVSSIEDPWNTIHEFGHSFGGLMDNYVGWILFDGNPTLADPYIAPNVDVGGCPKWCSAHSGVYETACTKITKEEECRHHERTYEYYPGVGYKWRCTDKYKCCVWLPSPDSFFKTRCVNFRGNKNIGINCYGNSGCYYGSNGQIAWRSTLDSGIMTDDQRRSLEFEDVSRRALEKIFQELFGGY